MTRRGHFSATESEDKGSSTGTTPKQSQSASLCFTTRTKPRLATFLVHRGRTTLTWTGPRGSAAGRFGRMMKIRRRARSELGIRIRDKSSNLALAFPKPVENPGIIPQTQE